MGQSPEGKSMMESIGNWNFAYLYIDEKANPAQRKALEAIARATSPPAAPPERTKVSPAIPMNSESRRRSLWSGLVQSAYPRWPPTEAMKAALPEVISCFRPVCGDVSRATAG